MLVAISSTDTYVDWKETRAVIVHNVRQQGTKPTGRNYERKIYQEYN